MLYVKQDDYDSFKCLAGKCPQSCCKGWEIVIDDESLESYDTVQGTFVKALDKGINWKDGTFKQERGRCYMLNEDDLCNIQLTLGEDYLCYTCKMYPRHVEEFEGVRELSLSLSCPEAARMAIERDNPYCFYEEEDNAEDDFYDFDYLLYTKLIDARKRIKSIICDREKNIFERMEIVLELARRLQDCHDKNDFNEMDEIIKNDLTNIKDKCFWIDEKANIDILYSLEHLSDDWLKTLDKAKCSIDEKSSHLLSDIVSQITNREQIYLENILALLIFTYFCGAVYDDEIYSKAALCVYSTWWIFLIYKICYNNENSEDFIKIVYSYAREVEHSDNNLNSIEKYFGANL